jgi:hypothetical protein
MSAVLSDVVVNEQIGEPTHPTVQTLQDKCEADGGALALFPCLNSEALVTMNRLMC